MTAPTRVAFVAAGAVSKPESYVYLAETYKRLLDRSMRPTYPYEGQKQLPAFDTQVFTEVEPALEWLKPETGGGRTLVLLSEAFAPRADSIAAQHPDIYVLVFSGAVRQRGKPYYVRKDWTLGEIICEIVKP